MESGVSHVVRQADHKVVANEEQLWSLQLELSLHLMHYCAILDAGILQPLAWLIMEGACIVQMYLRTIRILERREVSTSFRHWQPSIKNFRP